MNMANASHNNHHEDVVSDLVLDEFARLDHDTLDRHDSTKLICVAEELGRKGRDDVDAASIVLEL